MSTMTEIQFKQFADVDARRAATVEIMDNIHQVLFYFFEENEPEIDNDEVKNEVAIFMWSIATAAMASVGLRVIGVDEGTGRYVATLEPRESVKEFLINDDIAEDYDIFYEDFLEKAEPESGFNFHDDALMAD